MSTVILSTGIGNSGVDIAVDLSHTASQVGVRNSFFSLWISMSDLLLDYYFCLVIMEVNIIQSNIINRIISFFCRFT